MAAYGLFLIFSGFVLSMDNLTALYVLIFLTGGTIGGRVIVANNFFLEYFERRIKDVAIFIRFFSQMLLTLLYTGWLQYVRDYHKVAWPLFALGFIPLLFVLLCVPESPAWQEERGEKEDFK